MSVLLANKLPRKKIRTQDGTVLKLFSLFFSHPYMLNEDGWKLLVVCEEKILVDVDTLHIFGDCEIKLVYDKEYITHAELTSDLKDEALDKLYMEMMKYAEKVRAEMDEHQEEIDKRGNQEKDQESNEDDKLVSEMNAITLKDETSTTLGTSD
jgi:hypothetical protein